MIVVIINNNISNDANNNNNNNNIQNKKHLKIYLLKSQNYCSFIEYIYILGIPISVNKITWKHSRNAWGIIVLENGGSLGENVENCWFPLFDSQFKLLMEHLDPDEEDEEGETSANVRNKAITALLGGASTSPRNHHTVDSEYEDSDGEERTPGVRERKTTQISDCQPLGVCHMCSLE